jgi:hypothetical protein
MRSSDGKSLAELNASLDRGVDEHVVERRTSRCIRRGDAIHNKVAAAQWKIAVIGEERRDWRGPRANHTIEEPPLPQPRGAVPMNEVALRDFARERRLVDEEHPVAPAPQQHRCRCSGASGANHDCVVHLCLPPAA